MSTTRGTAHFTSEAAAIRYYKPYGFNKADVRRKLVAGEIHTGRPTVSEEETVWVNKDEGRYFIQKKS